MKKLLKTLVCTLALAAGLSSAAADNGDIYEIRPCNAAGETIAARTIDTPLSSGETFYFRMRLIGRGTSLTDPSTEDSGWRINYVGTGSSSIGAALGPLQIAIYVTDTPSGGGVRWATLENTLTAAPTEIGGEWYTDLIFSYTVKAGEIALPVRLASADGSAPISDTDTSTGYYFNPATKGAWEIVNNNSETCNLWQWEPNRSITNPESTSRETDITLANCGFYVKTIDFDDNWQTADTAWRTIHKNSTTPKNGLSPSLAAVAAVENAVSLYVWSDDDSVITVDGGEAATLNLDNAGATLETHIGKVTIYGGQTTGAFTLKAVGAEGATANIILSTTPYYIISSTSGVPNGDYLTVPVTVGEALPPTLTVQTSATSVTAGSNWTTAKASLTVEASQAYADSDVTITITPEVIGATADVGDYVRFSTQNSVAAIDSLASTIDVTLAAGSTETTPVYVYFLRADSHTTSSTVGITFTPEVSNPSAADDYFTSKNAAKVLVTSTPVISVDSPFTSYARQPTPVEITVSDAYADMADRTTGYKIYVRYPNATGSSFTQLSGTYYVGAGDRLYNLESDELPQLRFPKAGTDLTAYIYVVSPISGQSSSKTYAFTANIEASRQVTIVADKSEYTEGENATFTITLSAEYEEGDTLYAYLKPQDSSLDVSMFKGLSGNFVVGMANPNGIPITTTSATARLKLLDGTSEDAGGLNVSFSVVLSTDANWDGDENDSSVVALYSSDYANLTVYNAEPTFTRIEMNGISSEEDGYKFPNSIPKGMSRTFKAIVKDAGQYDLTNETSPFKTRWTVRRNGVVVSGDNPKEIEGNPNDDSNAFTWTFNQASTNWTITAQIKDKDMDDWAETTYTVGVEVLDNPEVVITPSADTYYETETSGTIDIGLSYWDEQFTGALEVEVTIAPRTVGRENAGVLKIDTTNNDIVPGSYEYDEDTGATTVRVSLTSAAAVSLVISEMDGTLISSSDGFVINAKVVSSDELPTSGTAASNYYSAAKQARVFIENADPVCTFIPSESNTNAWEVAGGPATSYPITWAIKSDVEADFNTTTTTWTEPGIRVTISGCDNETTEYVTEARSVRFIPDFGTAQGERTVTITIVDKDGGTQTMQYKYRITPSKFLTLIANGPSGATANNDESTKYATAKGHGEGHVYAGSTLSGATNFRLQWNCGSATTWDAFAFGYKVNAVDNGSLNSGRDCAISDIGGIVSSGASNYYAYSDATRDSFFYRWLPIAVETSGGGSSGSSESSSMISPEVKTGVPTISITLPTKMTDDDQGYFETKYEAIFSKEYRAKDNLGDINQDGIPDIYATGKGIWGTEALATSANDLDALGDTVLGYLPRAYAMQEDTKNDYAPGATTGQATDFTLFMKLRGVHPGLNKTRFSDAEADFSEAEELAYKAAFAEANGTAWTDTDGFDLSFWTPEPMSDENPDGMNLSLEDTDKDNLPDGWEYFFWYQAKVWVPAYEYAAANDEITLSDARANRFGAPREGQAYVFERFNINNIALGTKIEPSEVLAHFDPTVKADAEIVDFDGDGLTDLEELALGTNPCHWDTDGDHMSDAWEVLMGTDPLLDTRSENSDGDFMALLTTKGLVGWKDVSEDIWYFDIDGELAKDEISEGAFAVEKKFKRVLAIKPLIVDGEVRYYGREAETPIEPIASGGDWHWGAAMGDKPAGGWIMEMTVDAGTAVVDKEFVLVHKQVYDALGFDPRTGWSRTLKGYVSSRWEEDDDEAGEAVNTVPFSDYDEYLVMQYRRDLDAELVNDGFTLDEEDIFKSFRYLTTKPTLALESTEAIERLTEAGSTKTLLTGHGADTNEDGLPDGWSLYVGWNPSLFFGTVLPEEDTDGDGLDVIGEYAGTDSCNAYSNETTVCESVYKNHPGLATGWYNKFFPTDPRNADTDGDTISDGDEGLSWEATFPYEGEVYKVVHSFIYGEPTDDGSKCIRGGGMNPCALDTDRDWLPDPWEMQFAGMRFDATKKSFIGTVSGNLVPSPATLRADGLYAAGTTNATATATNTIFIAAGMDATWSGDAALSEKDSILGWIRDLDFDHDGLSNRREYLVQQMRHFRYDDTITPLMGYMLVGGARVEKFFVPMYQSPADLINEAKARGYEDEFISGLENTVSLSWGGNLGWTEENWRKLGYFATPEHKWDKSIESLLLPRRGAAGYFSTDPRMADTDGDGMDDYYEIFHGLNPILGSTDSLTGDIIYVNYGALKTDDLGMSSPESAMLNAWTQADGAATPNDFYDPIRYPWMMGTPEADADGDGLRNDEEKVLAGQASPINYHSDPTPAWFTDSTSTNSYVSQYYLLTAPVDITSTFWEDEIVVPAESLAENYYNGTLRGSTLGYISGFEENEGYDTDHDWKGDSREVIKTISSVSDPLKFTDPDRRQALYLNGTDGFAMSRVHHTRAVDSSDLFRQFTVEAWFKAESVNTDQVIIDRSACYPASSLAKDYAAIRANFRIGITAAGELYGLFDNSDAVESGFENSASCQIVKGGTVTADEWTHVALTYSGSVLTLYVNGASRGSVASQMIPANGIYAISQNIAGTNAISRVTYETYPGALFIGARPVSFSNLCVAMLASDISRSSANLLAAKGMPLAGMREFFKGYVDEVRVWDGARSANEIASAYRSRLTFDEVVANRLNIYTHLMSMEADSSRSANVGKNALAAELVFHYNFSTLPSATQEEYVSQSPVGFENALTGMLANAPSTFSEDIAWWANSPAASTVYADRRVVPLIPNTVEQLPIIDGSIADSFMYSDYLGGYGTHSTERGLTQYGIANSANPYGFASTYEYEHMIRLLKLDLFMRHSGLSTSITEDLLRRYMFTVRSSFTDATDLVPMGGAYARACSVLWDGLGSSTVWTDTGVDIDADGLPDWWEELYGGDVAWDDLVDYEINGQQVKISAWQAYLRDLAKGMQPDGENNSDYVQKADADGDGLVDWWKEYYGLTGGANDDDDNDGLSNYVEYLLSEVFNLGVVFDPTVACSVSEGVSDYFFKLGKMYVGEIFADHDRIRDTWEDAYAGTAASRYAYDALADADGDGWSNFAEFQAGTAPDKAYSLGLDGAILADYPVPTIKLDVTYAGKARQNLAGQPFVIKAWKNTEGDTELVDEPDAIWTIQGESTTNTVTKYIGINPQAQQTYHLSPGNIASGTLRFSVKDLNWFLLDRNTGIRYVPEDGRDTATWIANVTDRPLMDDSETGVLVDKFSSSENIVGSINYRTGAVTIDFSTLSPYIFSAGDIRQSENSSSSSTVDSGNYYSVYTLSNCYVQAEWSAAPITGGETFTYYLSDADATSTSSHSKGHLREGKTTFIAFCDLDGDGEYTAGEPYGAAYDVDVNWNYGKVDICLTDTHPVFARIKVMDNTSTSSSSSSSGSSGLGMNDRDVIFGDESSNVAGSTMGMADGKASGGEVEHVRVVRTFIDGVYYAKCDRVILDKLISVNSEKYLTEADFLKDTLDLDWDYLAEDVKTYTSKQALTNVLYRIVLGNGDIAPITGNATTSLKKAQSNNVVSVLVARKFDSDSHYLKAKPLAMSSGVILSPRPTFKWEIAGGYDTYTAFDLIIKDAEGTVIYNSGYQRMPARVKDATASSGYSYSWEPSIYAGSLLPDGETVFENNANYTWSVQVYNAKFNPNYSNWQENRSDETSFRMNVYENTLDYGTIDVAVRYFGPASYGSAATTNRPIRVQAFETPDFSGMPAAEGYVTDTTEVSSTNKIKIANAKLAGLKAGAYYVRAFIDTESDGKLADWESWGFACDRDRAGASLYAIKSIQVGPSAGTSEIVPVYIDDCDTDNDNLPDAWEMEYAGTLATYGAKDLDQSARGFAMREELTKELTENQNATMTSGLATRMLMSLRSPFIAAMALNLTPNPAEAVSAIDNASSSVEGDIAITGITIDTTNSKITLDVSTDLDAVVNGSAASTIYVLDSAQSATLQIWQTTSLSDPEWSIAKEVTIDLGNVQNQIDVAIEGLDMTSGFYKVTLAQ